MYSSTVIVQLLLKFNISLASQSRHPPPQPVMNMSDDNCAIDYLLQMYVWQRPSHKTQLWRKQK